MNFQRQMKRNKQKRDMQAEIREDLRQAAATKPLVLDASKTEASLNRAHREGVHAGVEQALRFANSCFTRAIETTKGIGPKLREKILETASTNFNTTEEFSRYSKVEDQEMFKLRLIDYRREQHLKRLESLVSILFETSTETPLTVDQFLSTIETLLNPDDEDEAGKELCNRFTSFLNEARGGIN